MLQIFNMYLNVSGMPSAVEPFKEMRSLEDVISERDDIVIQSTKRILPSMKKQPYLTWSYDLIPAEVNSSNGAFYLLLPFFPNFGIHFAPASDLPKRPHGTNNKI
ncbi:MAG: hypothetical protein KIC77_10255 [Clostridiales bacterium]|jgi:hypothetical protein|nr:hypothetical protein [Clostridiales bacterium]